MSMMIEILVAILLMLTVGYCARLNQRLKLLKGDEHALRTIIMELVTATEIAERAIAGLKATVRESDAGLTDRLTRAETMTGELDRRLVAGRDVLHRLSQIVSAGRGGGDRELRDSATAGDPRGDARSVAVAAGAFAEKLRTKVHGLAA
jgi:hypothetical protein